MDKETKDMVRTLGHLSAIGLTMALSIGIGAVFGNYLDGKFGTGPWLLIVFTAFGIAAAFKNLHRMYKRLKETER